MGICKRPIQMRKVLKEHLLTPSGINAESKGESITSTPFK
jgi:hypothetical protein